MGHAGCRRPQFDSHLRARGAAGGVRAFGSGVCRVRLAAGGSRLINGNTAEHEALEAELAAFFGREAALAFNTGYMANVGIIPALVGEGDLLVSDALNHASIIDGARLARAEVRYQLIYKFDSDTTSYFKDSLRLCISVRSARGFQFIDTIPIKIPQ